MYGLFSLPLWPAVKRREFYRRYEGRLPSVGGGAWVSIAVSCSLGGEGVDLNGLGNGRVFITDTIYRGRHISFSRLYRQVTRSSAMKRTSITTIFCGFHGVLGQLYSRKCVISNNPLNAFHPAFASGTIRGRRSFGPSRYVSGARVLFAPAPRFHRLGGMRFFQITGRRGGGKGTTSGGGNNKARRP